MTVQTDAAIAGFAIAAGITDLSAGGAAATAVAIAIAESGGDDHAWNQVPPDDSLGLWQINVYGALIGRLRQFGLTSKFQLWTPSINARAMYSISSGGTNWNPWSTYGGGGGAYLAFLARGNAAVGAPTDPTGTPGAFTKNSTEGMAFSYAQRWQSLYEQLLSGEPAKVKAAVAVLEQRDRDLEDFLATVLQFPEQPPP